MRTRISHQVEPAGPPVREQFSQAWPCVGAALALGSGLGLMVGSLVLALPHSRTLPSDTLALVDTCYMTGFSFVLAALMALPWAVIHRFRRRGTEPVAPPPPGCRQPHSGTAAPTSN